MRFLIPEKGVSAIDAPGQPFHDPEADAALFDALSANVEQTADRRLIRLPLHINDPKFSAALVENFRRDSSLGGFEMPRIERAKILEKFNDMVRRRVPIVGGGAGTGLSAKCEEAGGIDLIIIYNSGRYRMAGRGSAAGLLAYGNANEIVKEMAVEVLPVVKHTPVLAGVNGTDPFVLMKPFLAELKTMGFSGVQNFPTIGLFDGAMRQSFEETGMGYGLEVDMIALAHGFDLLTTPYVFNPDEARAMTKAGADIVVAHMGVTTGGSIGATSAKTLDECVFEIDAIADAALSVRKDVIVLCHGGPIAQPEDAEFVLQNCRALPRLLWRIEHGAPAGRDGADRADAEVQGDRFRRRLTPAVIGGTGSTIGRKRWRGKFVIAKETKPEVLDWGKLAWLSNPPNTGAKQLTVIDVNLAPGKGHDFHKHPDQEEVILVVAGDGRAMGRPREPRSRPGRLRPSSPPTWCMRPSTSATKNAKIVAILGPCVGPIGYELVDVSKKAPWKDLAEEIATRTR